MISKVIFKSCRRAHYVPGCRKTTIGSGFSWAKSSTLSSLNKNDFSLTEGPQPHSHRPCTDQSKIQLKLQTIWTSANTSFSGCITLKWALFQASFFIQLGQLQIWPKPTKICSVPKSITCFFFFFSAEPLSSPSPKSQKLCRGSKASSYKHMALINY